MPEVEIFWPESLPTETLLASATTLRDRGIDTTCRLQPVRRGGGLSVLVLLTTSALGPLLEAVFEHFGGEAWKALQRFVRQILGDDRLAGDGDSAHPEAVVFQSATTGAQFVFTPGMPALAFRRAIEQAPDGGPGRWVWDSARGKWIKFEELST